MPDVAAPPPPESPSPPASPEVTEPAPDPDALRGMAGHGPAVLGRALWAGLRGRCPGCGRRPLFASFYGLHEVCTVCGVRYEREPGAYLGALALGYTAGVLWVVCCALVELAWSPLRNAGWDPLWTIAVSALVVTALAYRPAKGVWFALLYAYGFARPDLPGERRT